MKKNYSTACMILACLYSQTITAMHAVEVGGFMDIAPTETASKSGDTTGATRPTDVATMPAVGAIAGKPIDTAAATPVAPAAPLDAPATSSFKAPSDTSTSSGATIKLPSADTIVYTDNPMFAGKNLTVAQPKPSIAGSDTISIASSEALDASTPVFSDIKKPDSTLPFDAQIQSLVDQLDEKLTNVRGIDAGISGLKILGVDAASIAAMPDPVIAKQLRTQIAQTAHALQLSLGNAMDYSDLATAAGLQKINDTYNNGGWSQIPPADLPTINEALARLSLPQITSADFSNNTLLKKMSNAFSNLVSGGSSGNAPTQNFRTLTKQANSIITLALDKADAYLANVAAGRISK